MCEDLPDVQNGLDKKLMHTTRRHQCHNGAVHNNYLTERGMMITGTAEYESQLKLRHVDPSTNEKPHCSR